MNMALSQDNFLLFWRNVLSRDDLLNMRYLGMVRGQRERPAGSGFAYARHRTEYAQTFPYPRSAPHQAETFTDAEGAEAGSATIEVTPSPSTI